MQSRALVTYLGFCREQLVKVIEDEQRGTVPPRDVAPVGVKEFEHADGLVGELCAIDVDGVYMLPVSQ
jgi:hypothetical protein